MAEMTVARALSELKMLDKKIIQALTTDTFVSWARKDQDQDQVAKTEALLKGNLQSLRANIDRARRIKRSLVLSNAITSVDIAGESMTVAEIIEMRRRINHSKMLAAALSGQYESATNNVESLLERLDTKATTAFTVGENVDKDMVQAFVEARKPFIIGVRNADTEAKKLVDFVDAFEREVDEALNVSNALTTLEVED